VGTAAAAKETGTAQEILGAVVRAMEIAGAKAVGAPEVAAVVRALGAVAVPAQAMEAVAEMPEAARDMRGAEVAIIRVPGLAAVLVMEMRAEAVLAPKAPGVLEAQAVRLATTAAEKLGERRPQHSHPQHQIWQAQQVHEQPRSFQFQQL